MIDILAHNLAPVMFLALIGFLLLGYPVAFSLGAVGLLFFVIIERYLYMICLIGRLSQMLEAQSDGNE